MDYINVENLASAISEELHAYAALANESVKKAVQKTAQAVKKEIQQTAPKDTGNYAKSWSASKTLERSGAMQMTVYSKDHYQIAHLLEKGHAKRNGGRVEGLPHIAPAEEHGKEMLEDLIRKALT